MIASTSNPRVKNLVQLRKKAKARRQQRLYVVEGVRMFREAPDDMIESVYVSESFLAQPENREMLESRLQRETASSGGYYEVLSDEVFDYVSDTKTPQGVLCLVRMRDYSLDEILGSPSAVTADPAGLWLALECLQDPGNLGTIFRTAEGAGVTGIFMDAFTADIYNPKTIRSTMGSIFRVPFYITEDLPGALDAMKSRGIDIFAACGDNGSSYTAEDYTGPTAFLIGNEGSGLSGESMKAADRPVRIPMRGSLESLNASVAAGILMYEADRQRRLPKQ